VFSDKFGPGLTTTEIIAVEFVAQIEETVVIVKMEEGKDNPIHLTGKLMNSLVRPLNEDGEKKWIDGEVSLAQSPYALLFIFVYMLIYLFFGRSLMRTLI